MIGPTLHRSLTGAAFVLMLQIKRVLSWESTLCMEHQYLWDTKGNLCTSPLYFTKTFNRTIMFFLGQCIMAYLTISSVHSHVSENSLRTYTDFFLGSWLLAISMLRPLGGGAPGPRAIKGTATPVPKYERMLHVQNLHQFFLHSGHLCQWFFLKIVL